MIGKLFRNARIFTPVDVGTPQAGDRQGNIRVYEKGAIYCRDGLIETIGEERDVLDLLAGTASSERGKRQDGDIHEEVDCGGRCLIPGFVDSHTHMCFAARRELEFQMRLDGVDYLEILGRGGGILSSVRAVRATSEEALFELTHRHALTALRFGTTTLEIKSGYGLDTKAELKMLRVIDRVGRETPLDVVPTFMGAHAIPKEFTSAPDEYVELIVSEMIPEVIEQGIARFCDVFCERGVFSPDQSRRILKAARVAGLQLRIHADEVHDQGGAALAAELRTTSAEHLLAASDEGLEAMARAGVLAVLLPATAYSLKKSYAPARRMVGLGVPVALATDCNPGTSYTESMPFVFGLAVLNMGLTLNEALAAATLNGAYAVAMADKVGSLEAGKYADFCLLDGDTPAILAYHAGVSPVVRVYKRGEAVFGRA